jgi:hypothetical protein
LDEPGKTTKQTGTIFDAQPTPLNSNIWRIDNPAQPVLGYLWISCQLDTNVALGISLADVIAGKTEEVLSSRGSAPNLKLPDKMMLLTKKDLNLTSNNCLLDICAKSDLSH